MNETFETSSRPPDTNVADSSANEAHDRTIPSVLPFSEPARSSDDVVSTLTSMESASDWPDPDIFFRAADLRSPRWPSGSLPDRIDKLIWDIAGSLGAPLNYVALVLLVSVAALVGCSRRIRVTPAWIEPSTIAGILVGLPGTMKSPVCDAVLRVILAIEKEELLAFDNYVRDLRTFRDVAKIQERFYARELREALALGQPLPPPPSVRLADVVIPDPPVLVATAGTAQGLRNVAARSRSGLFLAADELPRLKQWLENPEFRNFMMASLDGRHESVQLVSSGTIAADHLSLCVLSTVQPGILPALLGPDDGFYARMIWAVADRADCLQRTGDPLPDKILARSFTRIRGLVPEAWGRNAVSTEVELDPRAAQLACEAREHYQAEAARRDGLMASAYSKAGAMVIRLANALELLAYGLSTKSKPAGRIGPHAIEAATTLTEQLFLPSAEIAFGLAHSGVEDCDARDLLDLIRRRNLLEFTRRDIQRSTSGRLSRSDVLEKAIVVLAGAHAVRLERLASGPAGGAPKKVVRVNPKVHGPAGRH